MKPLDNDNLLKNRISEICDADTNSKCRVYTVGALALMGEIIAYDEVYGKEERNV